MDAGQVPLGVQIEKKRRAIAASAGSTEIEDGSRFANPAFLVEDGNAGHASSS
jgi:hypothetical protein